MINMYQFLELLANDQGNVFQACKRGWATNSWR